MENAVYQNYEERKEQYGGFWIRAGAYLIDSVIMAIPIFIGVFILSMMAASTGFADYDPSNPASAQPELPAGFIIGFILLMLFMFVLNVFYFAFLQSTKMQATVGKKLLGLKVTDLNGNRITFWRAFGRYLAMTFLSPIFYIGYIMVGVTEKKQGLHDMVASTLVVKR